MQILKSNLDSSVNFITPLNEGLIESRFVRRTPEYFIAYLSSHSGCNKACRFCHLTATGQTTFDEVSDLDMIKQAITVLHYYKSQEPLAQRVNFNWMARGEPLANWFMWHRHKKITRTLSELSNKLKLDSHFNVSTIMPFEVLDYDLPDLFKDSPIKFYYSLYSLDPIFRRRWVPKSIDPLVALNIFKEWQDETGHILTLHWPFIKDENDSLDTVNRILDVITKRNINARFNLVRYNPYSDRHGQESDPETLQRNFDLIDRVLGNGSKVVSRVGFDVKASCGMFVNQPC